MSYGFKIKSDGGQHEIVDTYGDIPDGTHEINGHEGADRNIHVVRRHPSGRTVITAGAQHYPDAE